jgi:hypothetical protein
MVQNSKGIYKEVHSERKRNKNKQYNAPNRFRILINMSVD